MASTASTSWTPSLWLSIREHLALWLAVLSLKSVPAQPPASRLSPALLVPGFLAGDWSLRPMARWLRLRGFRTFESGVRANVGCTQVMADALEARVVEIAATEGPISLVGHSRGGTLARLVAARRPDLVTAVVTLGSPLTAQFAASQRVLRIAEFLARLHDRGREHLLSDDCLHGDCAAVIEEQLAQPLPTQVSFTSVYSRGDGVVMWRSCLVPGAEHLRVRGSHNGLACNESALRLTTRRLHEAC